MTGRLQRDGENNQLSKRKPSALDKPVALDAQRHFSQPGGRKNFILGLTVMAPLFALLIVALAYPDATLAWRLRIQAALLNRLHELGSFLVAETSPPPPPLRKPVHHSPPQTAELPGKLTPPKPAEPPAQALAPPILNSNSAPAGKTLIGYSINADAWGHYRSKGRINGREVDFLVDTGATWVIIPDQIRWQLNLVRGESRRITTASDSYSGYAVKIEDLQVGPFHLQNVEGLLNPKAQNNEILLGMAALKSLDITQKNKTLLLKQAEETVSGKVYVQTQPAPAYDNAVENRRKLAEIKQKEDNCRYWKAHGLDYDLADVQLNIGKYCR